MSFQDIHDLLSRYRKYLSDSDEQQGKISAIITHISGVTLSEDELRVSKGELHIIGSSVLKNEVFLHKEHILSALHESGLTNIVEIR